MAMAWEFKRFVVAHEMYLVLNTMFVHKIQKTAPSHALVPPASSHRPQIQHANRLIV